MDWPTFMFGLNTKYRFYYCQIYEKWKYLTTMGLEPTIFRFEVGRRIRWATRPQNTKKRYYYDYYDYYFYARQGFSLVCSFLIEKRPLRKSFILLKIRFPLTYSNILFKYCQHVSQSAALLTSYFFVNWKRANYDSLVIIR